MTNYTNERTILTPIATRFTVDAWIYDARHINHHNKEGEFSVVFAPCTFYDHQALAELVETAVMEVEMKKDRYSNKLGVAKTEKGGGLFYSTQLFTPKVEPGFNHPDELVGRQCSIKGHLRDLPLGEVVINVEYVDCYDPLNGVEPENTTEDVSAPVVEDDW